MSTEHHWHKYGNRIQRHCLGGCRSNARDALLNDLAFQRMMLMSGMRQQFINGQFVIPLVTNETVGVPVVASGILPIQAAASTAPVPPAAPAETAAKSGNVVVKEETPDQRLRSPSVILWVGASILALLHSIFTAITSKKESVGLKVLSITFATLFGPLYWIYIFGRSVEKSNKPRSRFNDA